MTKLIACVVFIVFILRVKRDVFVSFQVLQESVAGWEDEEILVSCKFYQRFLGLL